MVMVVLVIFCSIISHFVIIPGVAAVDADHNDCSCALNTPLRPPDDISHPSDHNHTEDAIFLYTDTYVRLKEGESAKICATLNRPTNDSFRTFFEADSTNDYATAESDDYQYTSSYLIFEPGDIKKCFNFSTYDDTNAGEEDLESLYIYWAQYDLDTVYFYNSNYDNRTRSVVAIEDNDVLTLTPNTTDIRVDEGDYSLICLTPNQLSNRDTPTAFYVYFNDKQYTADIETDLQYTHTDHYPDFYHYGGVYTLYPNYNQTCFHFHTKDDNEFEGNEQFNIKLYSFNPLLIETSDQVKAGNVSVDNPLDLIFNFTDEDDDMTDYDDYDYHHHHHDKHGLGFSDFYHYYSERYTFNAQIPNEVSTIHVTIVDNEDVPCLMENTKPCFQLTEDIMCLYLERNANVSSDIPRPCRVSHGGLLGSLARHYTSPATP